MAMGINLTVEDHCEICNDPCKTTAYQVGSAIREEAVCNQLKEGLLSQIRNIFLNHNDSECSEFIRGLMGLENRKDKGNDA
jgi:hypothetical protein